MSAETLREAAALMRKAWFAAAVEAARLESMGEIVGTTAPTMMAVADWLDAVAFQAEGNPHHNTRMTNALAVAEAYLGGAS